MICHLLIFLAFGSQPFICSAWFMSERCYNEMEPAYRCYDLDDPYTNTLFHFPQSPSQQNVQYQLYTVTNPTSPQILGARDSTSVKNSNFDPNGKVVFVVHGFGGSGNEKWIKDSVKELLKKVPNVIAIDWRDGAKAPNYFRATANTRVVGAHTATLIKTLGVDPADVHLIGMSLGAHVVGYAGEKFTTKKIGRITGLDPAGPLYEGENYRVKLDRSDAAFVDVIHTDANGLGTEETTGHVDFWPNGGKSMPGCAEQAEAARGQELDFSDFAHIIGCDHLRVKDYFLASINDNNFTAYPCASLHDYKQGRCTSCGSGCNHMGYHATPTPSGLFVLDTKTKYPY